MIILHSIIWEGNDITPDTPFTFDSSLSSPTIDCKVYQLTINPAFYDITLNQTDTLQPSSWSLCFPNGTVAAFSSDAHFPQTQTGIYVVDTAMLNETNIAFPPVSWSLTSNTVWSFLIGLFDEHGSPIFAFDSNSTLTEPDYSTLDQTLSFTASGPSGTDGYTRVGFAKSLLTNPEDVVVEKDGAQIPHSLVQMGDSWLLSINYTHSSHRIAVEFGTADGPLPAAPPSAAPEVLPLTAAALIVFTLIAIVLLKGRKK
jgi:hypothetical protein